MMQNYIACGFNKDSRIENTIIPRALDETGTDKYAVFLREGTQAPAGFAIGNLSSFVSGGGVRPSTVHGLGQEDDLCSVTSGFSNPMCRPLQIGTPATAFDQHLNQRKLEHGCFGAVAVEGVQSVRQLSSWPHLIFRASTVA